MSKVECVLLLAFGLSCEWPTERSLLPYSWHLRAKAYDKLNDVVAAKEQHDNTRTWQKHVCKSMAYLYLPDTIATNMLHMQMPIFSNVAITVAMAIAAGSSQVEENEDALRRMESYGHNYGLHPLVMMRAALLQRSVGGVQEAGKQLD
eukprot:4595432-Amphidinium_carterae.2